SIDRIEYTTSVQEGWLFPLAKCLEKEDHAAIDLQRLECTFMLREIFYCENGEKDDELKASIDRIEYTTSVQEGWFFPLAKCLEKEDHAAIDLQSIDRIEYTTSVQEGWFIPLAKCLEKEDHAAIDLQRVGMLTFMLRRFSIVRMARRTMNSKASIDRIEYTTSVQEGWFIPLAKCLEKEDHAAIDLPEVGMLTFMVLIFISKHNERSQEEKPRRKVSEYVN
ncbi:hypothetical protein TNCV_595571, partial [Trichonephila clavipes]